MKILIVEDAFACRKILLGHLKQFGECDQAEDGIRAVNAVEIALQYNEPYNLICLDIMMPNMDGQEALREIRKLEAQYGKVGDDAATIIMTTAIDDQKNVYDAFRANIDAYLVKPISREQLFHKLEELNLINQNV